MKVCLVCSHGGHLTEMLYLLEVFEREEIFFVTYDSPRTQNLDYKKYLFPNFGERPLELLKNLHKIIKIIVKEKPDIIFSNGAEIAIPFFYLGKLFGKKTIFIECYTRINNPTVTGTFVYPVSDLFFVLWPELLNKYRKKAQYIGGIFEVSDKPLKLSENEKENMIFVTVGMHSAGFDRLIKKMDEIAEKTDQQIIMQIGDTDYTPKNAEYFKFKNYEEIKGLINKARLVVCQGAMTAIDSLILKTPVLIVPRSKEYKEVIDDHQLVFSKKLEKMGLVDVVGDINDLEKIINIKNQKEVKVLIKNRSLIDKLKIYVKA